MYTNQWRLKYGEFVRIIIICAGFVAETVNLQPWRHIFEIAKGIKSEENDVQILTNTTGHSPNFEYVGGLAVHRVDNLMRQIMFRQQGVSEILGSLRPDVIVWVGKPLSCLVLSRLIHFNTPIVWLLETGTTSMKSLASLSFTELTKGEHSLGNEFLNTVFPKRLLRRVANSPAIKEVIVPSSFLKNWLHKNGVSESKITVIPSALEESFRSRALSVSNRCFDKNSIIRIIYMGSPCSLRGPDVVIRSVRQLIDKTNLKVECIILSRRKLDNANKHLLIEEQKLRDLVGKLGLQDSIQIIPGLLSKDELIEHILGSDIVVFPFKVLQSEMPLAVLETMALGKVVIATKIRTLEDLVGQGRGFLIDSCSPEELCQAMLEVVNNPCKALEVQLLAKKFALETPTWSEVVNQTISVIER